MHNEQVDRLREALKFIARRSAPGTRTFDSAMHDMEVICDRAREALSRSPDRSPQPAQEPVVRCSQCDNGIELRWDYCPWCGEVGDWDHPLIDSPQPAQETKP